jgi:error-prone DNA polymerase
MPYTELHCHSYYSLLDGASSPEDLVAQAAALGMPALALTDHNNLYGAVRFATAARRQGIKPIFGAEVTLPNEEHLTLLVENPQGWRNLCTLITAAQHNAPKGDAELPHEVLEAHTAGLIALSGCRQGALSRMVQRSDMASAQAAGAYYRDLFGPDHFWIELHNHLLPDDARINARLVDLAAVLGVGIVATNNVHYATRERHRLQDVLVCIRHLTTLAVSETLRRPNSEYYLKDAARMQPLFAAYPQALANTQVIADRCNFDLQYGLQSLPQYPVPGGLDASGYLRQLCMKALSVSVIEVMTGLLSSGWMRNWVSSPAPDWPTTS